jgi:hypothetical protein
VAVVVTLGATSCAAIEGLDKYAPGPSAPVDASADTTVVPHDATMTDVTPEAATEGGPTDDGSDDGLEEGDAVVQTDGPATNDAPPYDAGSCMSAVDPAHGVFVAPPPGGVDARGCGTLPTMPCQTISAGIATANAKTDGAARTIVYVAEGTYTETVTLSGGVTVQGGWHWDGGSNWSFECTTPAATLVKVQAPASSNMTVVATANDSKTTTLSTLTVLSKATANAGESLYGVFATGANTVLALTDVIVTMQAGGKGQDGSQGGAGSAAGAAGSCGAASDGNNASTPGGAGTAGAVGSFSATGYTTHVGGTGGNGSTGDNGMAGPGGVTVVATACGGSPCAIQSQGNCDGGAGLEGCGGGGGLGGTGGSGGGSSVAVFANDATVTITAGGYLAGNGGNGGAGGAGGAGAAGGGGAPGFPTNCPASSCSGTSCVGGVVSASGGDAGTSGGRGSTGGQGGGGAGGDSYTLVTLGLAKTRLTLVGSPALTAGNPGMGGPGNGSAGLAATGYP